MRNWDNYDTILEIVEELATYEGWVSSEEELSKKFDEEVAPLVIEQYGENDSDAMNQSFNDWSDSLCKDGEIHEAQYNEYTYVGKYS